MNRPSFLTNKSFKIAANEKQDLKANPRQKPLTLKKHFFLNPEFLKESIAITGLYNIYCMISILCWVGMSLIKGECAHYPPSEAIESNHSSLTRVPNPSPHSSLTIARYTLNEEYNIEQRIMDGLYNSGLIDSFTHQGFPPPVQLASRTNTETLPSYNSDSVNDREMKSPSAPLASIPIIPAGNNRLINYLDFAFPAVSVCKDISPFKKTLIYCIPDLSYFAYLTTACLTGDRTMLNISIVSSVPYGIYFLYHLQKRARSCLRFLGRRSEQVVDAPDAEISDH